MSTSTIKFSDKITSEITKKKDGIFHIKPITFSINNSERIISKVGFNLSGQRLFVGDKVSVILRNDIIPVIIEKL